MGWQNDGSDIACHSAVQVMGEDVARGTWLSANVWEALLDLEEESQQRGYRRLHEGYKANLRRLRQAPRKHQGETTAAIAGTVQEESGLGHLCVSTASTAAQTSHLSTPHYRQTRTKPPAGPSGVPSHGLAHCPTAPSPSPVPQHIGDTAETHKAEHRQHATRRAGEHAA